MPSALPSGDPAPPDGRLPASALAGLSGQPFGIYVHVPFCSARCGYCDFNTYTATELGPSVSRDSYADTVLLELRLARDVLVGGAPPVSTVFFGGGTPTLLPAGQLGVIVAEIDELFGLAPDVEITTEANPESVTPAYLTKLREAGFTRLSVGMQSAVPKVLEVLDRKHRPGRPEEVVAEAHAAGFEHVNLDLIYGSPYETDDDWQASLDAAIAAGPDHISAYALVVEEGTGLARQVGARYRPGARRRRARRPLRAGRRDAATRPATTGTRSRTGPARTRRAAGTTSSTGRTPTGGAPDPAHIATSAACAGGTSSTRCGTPRRWRPARSPAAGREPLGDSAQLTERVMLGVRMRVGAGGRRGAGRDAGARSRS